HAVERRAARKLGEWQHQPDAAGLSEDVERAHVGERHRVPARVPVFQRHRRIESDSARRIGIARDQEVQPDRRIRIGARVERLRARQDRCEQGHERLDPDRRNYASFLAACSPRTQALSSVCVTASTSGPMKMPIRPNEIRPPITPRKMRSSGSSAAPCLIRNGRRKLSSVAAMMVTMRRKVPMPGWPLQYNQITGTTSTNAAPIWATARRNISAVRTEAKGIPAMNKPMPPTAVCTSAVTTTPRATLRIACPARLMAASPRSPPRREPKRSIQSAAPSPQPYRIAAATTVSTNWTKSLPKLPISATNHDTSPRA